MESPFRSLAERAASRNFSLEAYTKGMSELNKSGLFELLREYGRVQSASPSTPNYIEYQSALAHFSVGFNQALDLVLQFRELVLDSQIEGDKPTAAYNAFEKVVTDGTMTKEEAEKIKQSGEWMRG